MRIQQLSASALLFFRSFFVFAPMAILRGAIDWPASLDFPPEQTLPLIQAEQATVRLGYGLYLAWSLALAGSAALIVRLASGDRALRALSMLAIALGVAAALARAIGVARWLSGSTALAGTYAAAPDGSVERVAFEPTQTALNAYGGTIGEDLGVGMFAAMWLACVGALILKNCGLPSWLGWLAFFGCSCVSYAFTGARRDHVADRCRGRNHKHAAVDFRRRGRAACPSCSFAARRT